jgi:mono/diheme cytochrome c family protein
MKTLAVICGLAAAVFFVAACGDAGAASNAPSKPAVILRKAVPPAYKDSKPPEGLDLASADVIAAGKTLYHNNPPNCFACHGDTGKGDGSLGKEHAPGPAPTDLTSAEFQTGVKDDYIFWRIKKGGEGGPQGTIMTGFPGATDEEICSVVAYVRSLKGK